MILFPSMIHEAAKQAHMRVPDVDHCEDYNPDTYPHWHVFCNVQLGVPCTWGNHWKNAKLIAAIPEEQLWSITREQLEEMGFRP